MFLWLHHPQSKVLELLQKLQNSKEKVKAFGYEDAKRLQDLLYDHLKKKGLNEENFEMVFLTAGENLYRGLAILYDRIDREKLLVWGFGTQKFVFHDNYQLFHRFCLASRFHQDSSLCYLGIMNRLKMRTLHLNVSERIHCSKN